MVAELLGACAVLFGVAGVAVLVASLYVRDGSALRRLYVVEFLTVGWIVLPAAYGAVALAIALVPLALVAQRELLLLGAPGGLGRLERMAMGLCAALVLASPGGTDAVGTLWVLGCLALVAVNVIAAEGGLDRLARSATSLFLPGVCLAHLVWLAAMPHGFGWVAFLFGVVECNDAFALLVGRLVGTRKAFPRLSPNKTWAGVAGGAVAGVAAGLYIGGRIPGAGLASVAIGALFVVALGVVGDLAASRLKRAAGVKDFGDVFPGHGGLLDTYDTLLFAAPPFYHLLRAVS